MRKTPYKTYSIRMRERAVERMLLGESATRLAEEFGSHRTLTLNSLRCQEKSTEPRGATVPRTRYAATM